MRRRIRRRGKQREDAGRYSARNAAAQHGTEPVRDVRPPLADHVLRHPEDEGDRCLELVCAVVQAAAVRTSAAPRSR
jgi:hypothetical protein